MEIQVAVAKINKHGSEESGDTLELVERPGGGISVVMADGKASGHEAKSVSAMVVRRVIGLLADGVRDGAAARAASDTLYTERSGRAGVYLNILSADLQTGTLVLSRNNPTPVFIAQNERVECISTESGAIGVARSVRPSISEIPLQVWMTVVMYTDGVSHAGEASGESLDICTHLIAMIEEKSPTAQQIADSLLQQAVRLDHGRPNDDMTVVALCVFPSTGDPIRRLSARFPVPEYPQEQ